MNSKNGERPLEAKRKRADLTTKAGSNKGMPSPNWTRPLLLPSKRNKSQRTTSGKEKVKTQGNEAKAYIMSIFQKINGKKRQLLQLQ
jgi:hypothetical protein